MVNFLLKFQFCELGNNVCPIQGNAWIVWDSPSSASLSVNLNLISIKVDDCGVSEYSTSDVLKCFFIKKYIKIIYILKIYF